MENDERTSSDEKSQYTEKLKKKITRQLDRLHDHQLKKLDHFLNSIQKGALSIAEASQILDCSIDTVRRAISGKYLEAFQLRKKGEWRITFEALEKYMKKGAKNE